MRAHRAGRLVAVACLPAVVAGGAVLGAGAATASGPAAGSAAGAVVLESCSAHVVNDPGQPITLRPAAVEPPVLAALAPLDPLGVVTPLFRQVWAAAPPIPLGTIPATGQAVVTGDAIANAVTERLLAVPVLAPVLDPLLGSVWNAITRACTVVGEAVADATGSGSPTSGRPAPGQPAPGQPAGKPSSSPAAAPRAPTPSGQVAPERPPGAPAASGQGANVALEYPVEWRSVSPGVAGLPPEGVALKLTPAQQPGTVPRFGVLGQDDQAARDQAAGSAEPVSSEPSQALGGPVILAALLLTLVAAQLGRRWILRRSEPAAASRLNLRWRQLRVPVPTLVKRTE